MALQKNSSATKLACLLCSHDTHLVSSTESIDSNWSPCSQSVVKILYCIIVLLLNKYRIEITGKFTKTSSYFGNWVIKVNVWPLSKKGFSVISRFISQRLLLKKKEECAIKGRGQNKWSVSKWRLGYINTLVTKLVDFNDISNFLYQEN